MLKMMSEFEDKGTRKMHSIMSSKEIHGIAGSNLTL